MKIKHDCRYSLVVPTSMGVRITPENGQPVHAGNRYCMHATSAESNVASIASCLGLPVRVLTAFVRNSPVARFIKNDLKKRHMDYEGPEIDQGGPWGYRHQFNIADSGSGARGPRVHNDRAGEVGRIMRVGDFDLEELLGGNGAAMVHLSGLFAALSPESGKFCLELVRAAGANDTLVSFDLNHRASFWEGREVQLRETFEQIASLSDILVGNEEDFQLCFGIEGPETGGENISDKIEAFKEMIGEIKQRYSNASVFTTTLREVIDANKHIWGAVMHEGGNWHIAEPREISVLDRIGGGDGFVGGLLYGILKGWEPAKWLQFGWASGALAVTMLTDYAQPVDEEQVWSIWRGNARVRR